MSGTQLTLGRIACHHGLQHLDVGCTVEVFADGPEERGDRGGGAVNLQRFVVDPLLDEDERAVGLVQRVQLAANVLTYQSLAVIDD